ncbi:MAG TPA: UDP-N-acetyl-D-mannosamine dehydrogenase [Candidatus Limnocylindria bacterium]|jgi:UDP-N-acetyl-D-mannosaminuronic acid dehydrogenase
MSERPSVCVVGLGYIGLPTAAMLAAAGYQVTGIDVNRHVVETVSAGGIHISEPGLAEVVAGAVQSGRLQAGSAPVPADVFIICVPTPFSDHGEIRTPDISYVQAAARSLSGVVAPGNLIVIESTCPVGTTELIRDELAAAGLPMDEIRAAYCPERVIPGRILMELFSNDRIVGGVDPASTAAAESFYRGFVTGSVFTTTSRTAEMVKLVENSYRDVNIAFANEVSILSDHLEIDPWEVIALANRHPRVQILEPGPGVGGHCIAVDPWFIVARDPEAARLIRVAREVNDAKTEWVIAHVRAAASDLEGALGRPVRVACLGLAYKPDVDDLRESPAVRVAEALSDSGIEVLVCEPNLESHPRFELRDCQEAIDLADLVVVLVRHRQFAGLSVGDKPMIDTCGLTARSPAPSPTAVG